MPVRQWMTDEVEHLNPAATAAEAVALMERWGIRHVLVVEGEELRGMVSSHDILRVNFQNPGRIMDLEGCTVADIMTPAPLVTTEVDTTLQEAAELMHEQRIGSLPVLEAGRLVGVITAFDLLRALARGAPA